MKPAHLDPADLERRLTNPPGDDRGRGAEARSDVAPCGDFNLRIGRDGTWFYHGSPIARKPLVKLFASVLHRDTSGQYWLITPAERGRIDVDDLPFTAVALEAEGAGREQRLIFRTNLDDIVAADRDHPIRVECDPATRAPAPSIMVHRGLAARIARPVFYELAALAVVADDPRVLGVWSAGHFFPLGEAG